jgi:coenzyme F420-reducing hydrogenase gamma subunit
MEETVERKKPRLGFFKYSCCAGCEFQFIYFQKFVAEVLQFFDFIFCKMLSSGGAPEGPFDIALVEGTITESWQIDELKKGAITFSLLVHARLTVAFLQSSLRNRSWR